MNDELFDRTYQSGRAALNDGLDRSLARFGRSLMAGFETLNRIRFAAPWARKADCTREGGCA